MTVKYRWLIAASFVLVVLAGAALTVFLTRPWDAELPAPWPAADQADLVVVKKGERSLFLLKDGRVLREYPVGLGFDPFGHKEREGDGRTPEGAYVIEGRNPRSRYHLSLKISYPSPEDRAAAQARGDDPGGDIMIHGMPNNFGYLTHAMLGGDWTAGCVAVTNEQVREIWAAVPNGTPIRIEP